MINKSIFNFGLILGVAALLNAAAPQPLAAGAVGPALERIKLQASQRDDWPDADTLCPSGRDCRQAIQAPSRRSDTLAYRGSGRITKSLAA